MTQQEQTELLDLIKHAQDLNERKTDLMEEIIKTARTVSLQNEILKQENALLKQQLEFAERHILNGSSASR